MDDLFALEQLCAERSFQLGDSMESLGVMFGCDEDIEAHAEAAVTASVSWCAQTAR